jgi:hypothetical protein
MMNDDLKKVNKRFSLHLFRSQTNIQKNLRSKECLLLSRRVPKH